jgi:hypothetical protein
MEVFPTQYVFSLLVPYTAQIALTLADSQYPPRSDWPELVQILSKVIHCRADQADCDNLLERYAEFFTRLYETSPHDPDGEFAIPTEPYAFVSGLLSLQQGRLSKFWQLRLVTILF